MTLTAIKGTGNSGDFVFTLDSESGKGTATKEGFGHVHKHWFKQTQAISDGIAQMDAERRNVQDLRDTLDSMTPSVNGKGQFVMKYKDGREFVPTEHAINQMGSLFKTGTWYPNKLATSKQAGAGEVLAKCFAFGIKELPAKSKRLFRTRTDGTLRAVLSGSTKGYSIIDNSWFMEIVADIIPGGRLSHWRGDCDTIYGNVLIPDTIREEDDSDYGGMVAVSNSEIGQRALGTHPSVFRAICMNGCIWNQTHGKALRQVHKGKLNLASLKATIRENIELQIPLLPAGIQRMLGIKAFGCDIAAKPLIAQTAYDHKLSPTQARSVLEAYAVEPQFERTLFGVVNAITRAGQKRSNVEWVNFDAIGGRLVGYDRPRWDSLVGRAAKLGVKEVDNAFKLVESVN